MKNLLQILILIFSININAGVTKNFFQEGIVKKISKENIVFVTLKKTYKIPNRYIDVYEKFDVGDVITLELSKEILSKLDVIRIHDNKKITNVKKYIKKNKSKKKSARMKKSR